MAGSVCVTGGGAKPVNETRQGVTSTVLAAAPVSPSVVSIPMEGKIGTSCVRSLSVLELTFIAGDVIGAAYVDLCLLVEQAL